MKTCVAFRSTVLTEGWLNYDKSLFIERTRLKIDTKTYVALFDHSADPKAG
jgi:hypothetical protein